MVLWIYLVLKNFDLVLDLVEVEQFLLVSFKTFDDILKLRYLLSECLHLYFGFNETFCQLLIRFLTKLLIKIDLGHQREAASILTKEKGLQRLRIVLLILVYRANDWSLRIAFQWLTENTSELRVSIADEALVFLAEFKDHVAQSQQTSVYIVAFSLSRVRFSLIDAFWSGKIYEVDFWCFYQIPLSLGVCWFNNLDLNAEDRMRSATLVILIIVSNSSDPVTVAQVVLNLFDIANFKFWQVFDHNFFALVLINFEIGLTLI